MRVLIEFVFLLLILSNSVSFIVSRALSDGANQMSTGRAARASSSDSQHRLSKRQYDEDGFGFDTNAGNDLEVDVEDPLDEEPEEEAEDYEQEEEEDAEDGEEAEDDEEEDEDEDEEEDEEEEEEDDEDEEEEEVQEEDDEDNEIPVKRNSNRRLSSSENNDLDLDEKDGNFAVKLRSIVASLKEGFGLGSAAANDDGPEPRPNAFSGVVESVKSLTNDINSINQVQSVAGASQPRIDDRINDMGSNSGLNKPGALPMNNNLPNSGSNGPNQSNSNGPNQSNRVGPSPNFNNNSINNNNFQRNQMIGN